MILMILCIIVLSIAIIINIFEKNIGGFFGYSLALMNYIALQIALGNITF